MEPQATDESSTTAGPNGNDEINWVHPTKQSHIKHQGARPKTYSQGTKPTCHRNRPHDRPAQREKSAMLSLHYGKSCEKTKDVMCYACGGKKHFTKMCKSKAKKVHVLLENNDEENEEVFFLKGLRVTTPLSY